MLLREGVKQEIIPYEKATKFIEDSAITHLICYGTYVQMLPHAADSRFRRQRSKRLLSSRGDDHCA